MTITPRPHQDTMLSETREKLRTKNSVLLQGPTGVGKTILAAYMLANARAKGKRSLFIVHRQELIDQSAQAFNKIGIPYGYIATGYPVNPFAPVQICSIDTLKNKKEKIQKPDLVIWDECHHCKASGWQKTKAYFSEAKHVGLTATPCRLDGKGLDDVFDDMVLGPTTRWLIDNGFLSEFRVYAPYVPDMATTHNQMGDFNKEETAAIMDNSSIIGDAIGHYKKLAHGKKAVVFCVSVKHSTHVAEQFCLAGYRAIHIDGSTPRAERKRAIDGFRNGYIDILCNVDLFGEGFDLPAIECVVDMAPTQSLTKVLQRYGRALRMVEGKEYAVILDHAGNVHRHGLPDEEREWSLKGEERVVGKRKKVDEEALIKTLRCGNPDCRCMHSPAPQCPACGFVYEATGRTPKEKEGQLIEIDKTTFKKQQKAEVSGAKKLDDLIELGRKRGYKNPEKWAAHIHTWRVQQDAKRHDSAQQEWDVRFGG